LKFFQIRGFFFWDLLWGVIFFFPSRGFLKGGPPPFFGREGLLGFNHFGWTGGNKGFSQKLFGAFPQFRERSGFRCRAKIGLEGSYKNRGGSFFHPRGGGPPGVFPQGCAPPIFCGGLQNFPGRERVGCFGVF